MKDEENENVDSKDKIEIATLRSAINMILDHVENDLHIKIIPIDRSRQFYWDLDLDLIYNVLNPAPKPLLKRIQDDCDFLSMLVEKDGQDYDTPSVMLMHVVPLLSLVCDVVRA